MMGFFDKLKQQELSGQFLLFLYCDNRQLSFLFFEILCHHDIISCLIRLLFQVSCTACTKSKGSSLSIKTH